MRIITIIVFCFLTCLNLYGQVSWERLSPKPTGNTGKDIFFVDDQKGFLINSSEIIKTDDGGTTWEILENISSGNKISFFNSTGFIIGNNGLVYKSLDNGQTWSSLNTSFSENLNAISIIDKNTLRVTGDNRLHYSDDGGTSWTSLSIPNVNVEDSYFTRALVGHVACTNGTILKTVDGGQNWYETETSNTIPSDFFRIVFINENLGFASQEHNNIYKTTNGGESWVEINSPLDAAYSIHFIDEQIGFIAGEHGAMHKTMDGGETWDWIGFDARKSGNDLYSVVFLNQNEGFATGLRGRIIKTTDGGISWSDYSPIYNTIDRLQFTSDEIGYIEVGSDYYKTIDGGINWEIIDIPDHYEYAGGFQFINDDIGYSIGGGTLSISGSVFKTTDGGSNWNELDIKVDEGLSSVHFIDENTGFISGGFNRKTTLKTIDGGISWKQVIAEEFVQIQIIDSQIGYANRIGYSGGRIYKSVDGGETWDVNFEVDEEIRSFYFVNDTVGYIVGDNALIYRTFDGGNSWIELEIPYEYYEYVKFYSNYLGYILDEEGQLYRTLDGGESWESLYRLYGINSITLRNLDIYLSGENGSILKSSIDSDELIDINQLLLVSITDSTATVNTVVKSSLNKKTINIELGVQSGSYESTFELGSYYDYSNSINYSFKDLEPSTEYFCRLVVTDGNFVRNSQEFSFTTDSELVTSELVTGIGNDTKQIAFSIYPNPASNSIKIEWLGSFLNNYSISSLDGRLMLVSEMSANGIIDISHINNGIYLLRLKRIDGSIATEKFLKK